MKIVDTEVFIDIIPNLLNKWQKYQWIKTIKKIRNNDIYHVYKNVLISWNIPDIDKTIYKYSNLLLLKSQLLLKVSDKKLSIFVEECGEMKYYFVMFKKSILYLKRSKENLNGEIRNMLQKYQFIHGTEIFEVQNVNIEMDTKSLYTGSYTFHKSQDKFSYVNRYFIINKIFLYLHVIIFIINIIILISFLMIKKEKEDIYDVYKIQIAQQYKNTLDHFNI